MVVDYCDSHAKHINTVCVTNYYSQWYMLFNWASKD